MKKIKYEIYQSTTEEGVDITIIKEMPWSEVNEENARQEAYNGEYEIFDDGEPEPEIPADDSALTDRVRELEEQLAAAKILLGVE